MFFLFDYFILILLFKISLMESEDFGKDLASYIQEQKKNQSDEKKTERILQKKNIRRVDYRPVCLLS